MKLIKGDCLEKMKDIPDGSVDAIITDPPYGTTACKWDSVIPFEPMWEQLNRIIKPNGVIVLLGSEPFSSALRISNIDNYKLDLKWIKSRPTGFLNANRMALKNIEDICIFYKKQPVYNPQFTIGKPNNIKNNSDKKIKTNNIYNNFKATREYKTNKKYPKQDLFFHSIDPNKLLHPTQKPTALMEYLIRTYTNENETVLDFTMGSGTTGVACVNTKRQFIGIEQDHKYFEIACKRIADAQKQIKLF